MVMGYAGGRRAALRRSHKVRATPTHDSPPRPFASLPMTATGGLHTLICTYEIAGSTKGDERTLLMHGGDDGTSFRQLLRWQGSRQTKAARGGL
jgi:hypothetical protein